MATEILMPRQGQSVESCIIIEWKVSEGDVVTQGQALCEVETDKATFEVEATAAGTVLGIFYPADADVDVLKVIAALGEPGEDISGLRPETSEDSDQTTEDSTAMEVSAAPVAEEVPSSDLRPLTSGNSSGASPRAKNLAEKKGVDASTLVGSGPNGRVIERDVVAAQPASISPAAQARAASEGLGFPTVGSGVGGRVLSADLVEVASLEFPGARAEFPVRGIRKLVANRMMSSLQNTAQLTLNTSADARSVLDYRKKCKAAAEERGVGGISINDAVLYATLRTLAQFPELNAHGLGTRIVQFEEVHLGFAVDTPRGLMVPVIRFANRMNLRQLSAEAKRLAMACIEGTIDPDSLTGGTFTVTNLGAMGIESFTPVLNAPEVGILGVCSIELKPVMTDGNVEFVPHMGLSLTIDHCAVDGAPAAKFLSVLRQQLADFEFELTLGE